MNFIRSGILAVSQNQWMREHAPRFGFMRRAAARFLAGEDVQDAVTAARSRALTMTNFARSSLALVLRAVFGGAKSCALVKLFMICPPVGSRQSTTAKFLPLDRGYLMAQGSHF